MDYSNKLILAPMVRIGTVPFRLLALEYGADIVYTQELVDISLLKCQRYENRTLRTVDFAEGPLEEPTLRICREREGGRVVLQVGTNDPKRAAAVAKLVGKDVDGIDVNMGCPKPFSVHSGMGAALLKKPDLVKEILASLISAAQVPVTCKIRLLPDEEQTLALCRMIEGTGVAALAVHGRTETQRSKYPNNSGMIRKIAETLSIPVIANGGSLNMKSREDILKFRDETGASSVMVARAAMWNPSIFRPDGPLPLVECIKRYAQLAIDFEANETNLKYTIQRMMREDQTETAEGQTLLASTTVMQIADIWGLKQYCLDAYGRHRDSQERERRSRERLVGDGENDNGHVDGENRTIKPSATIHSQLFPDFPSEAHVSELPLRIPKRKLSGKASPKSVLTEYCKQKGFPMPKYLSSQRKSDQKCRAIVTVGEQHYTSVLWERNKRFGESAAAQVAVYYLKLAHLLPDDMWDGAIMK